MQKTCRRRRFCLLLKIWSYCAILLKKRACCWTLKQVLASVHLPQLHRFPLPRDGSGFFHNWSRISLFIMYVLWRVFAALSAWELFKQVYHLSSSAMKSCAPLLHSTAMNLSRLSTPLSRSSSPWLISLACLKLNGNHISITLSRPKPEALFIWSRGRCCVVCCYDYMQRSIFSS